MNIVELNKEQMSTNNMIGKNLEFKTFDNSFFELSCSWLQDPYIIKMINAKSLSLEESKQWFLDLPKREDYKIWGVNYCNIPIGVIGIKKIKDGCGEYFGYIGESDYRGKGLGNEMIKKIIIVAKNLGLTSLFLSVRTYNHIAIKLYEKNGFEIIKSDLSRLIMKKNI